METMDSHALAVDDDPVILLDISDILEKAGFRTLSARSVDEALVMLARYADSITLLFTDVEVTGDRNGFELARLTAQRWPQIGILVASGNISPNDRDLPEGSVFIRKPFSADVVYDRLHELLPDGQKPEPLKHKIKPSADRRASDNGSS